MANEFLKALAIGGGTLGAGAGIHGLGLGELLDPLDYPRQALYNFVDKPLRVLTGVGDTSELWGALPGVAGGLMGAAVGGPVGVLAGSALGGLVQGLGKATGSAAFEAPKVSDITGTEDFLPNLAVGMLTDPLTYAGAFGVGKQGAAAAKGAAESAGILSGAAKPASTLAGFGTDVPAAITAASPLQKALPAAKAAAPVAEAAEAAIPVAKLAPPMAKKIAPTFYSRLEEAIHGLPDHPIKSESVINQLKKAKGGVAGEEIEYTGLEEMLNARRGQKVSKKELLEHFKENQLTVEETWLKEPAGSIEIRGERIVDTGIRYPGATTPGGQDHFELLIKMPEPKLPKGYKFQEVDNPYSPTGRSTQIVGPQGEPMFNNALYYDEEQALQAFNSRVNKGMARWEDPHFPGHKDLLAFVQGHTRVGPKGEKILHVDSVQSDLHRKGAKAGYRTPELEQAREKYNSVADEIAAIKEDLDSFGSGPVPPELMPEFEAAEARYSQLHDQWRQMVADGGELDKLNKFGNAVPDLPFKENWHELAMKRVIRYAAENNFDAVTINMAEQAGKVAGAGGETPYLKMMYGQKGIPAADKAAMEAAHDARYNNLLMAKAEANDARNYQEVDRLRKELDALVLERRAVPPAAQEGAIPKWLKKYGKQHGVKVEQSAITGPGGKLTPLGEVDPWDALISQIEDRGMQMSAFKMKNADQNYAGVAKMLAGEGIAIPPELMSHPIADVTRFDMTPKVRENVLTRGQPLMSFAPLAAAGGGSALLAALMGQREI